jgi:hypothetical protein
VKLSVFAEAFQVTRYVPCPWFGKLFFQLTVEPYSDPLVWIGNDLHTRLFGPPTQSR